MTSSSAAQCECSSIRLQCAVYQFSPDDFNGIFRLCEAEDPHLLLVREGYANISLYLSEEGQKASIMGVYKFLNLYQETGTISRRPGSGQASKISPKAKHVINQQMTKDDESTRMELHKILTKDGIVVSSTTALRWRNQLGWTSKGTSYCQMISDALKEKPLALAHKHKGLSVEDDYTWGVFTRACQTDSESV